MKVLLLSAYDAASHRAWRAQLTAYLPEIDWHQLVLPARYFNWRIRGNSLSWAYENRDVFEQDYDLLLATDMVDLNGLRGFVPQLGSIPTIVYFHENQFAYPLSDAMQAERFLEPKIVNLYSALSADKLVFNSHYNRDSFVDGVTSFLNNMPDHVPPDLVEGILEKSTVIAVPIAEEYFQPVIPRNDPPVLLWNHRWEYDKAPERLYALLEKLCEKNTAFKINIIGPHFRRQPDVFSRIEQDFSDYIIHFGYLDTHEEYLSVLHQSDYVLSTAIHDFQGLALIEAIASGCIPIVPNRLYYPDYIPSTYCYESYLDDIEQEATAMAGLLSRLFATSEHSEIDVSRFKMENLKPQYMNIFKKIMK